MRPARRVPGGYGALVALALVACRPSIGDRCTLSTDCSAQGDRPCDTAQPGGYCTALNCTDNSCPDHAVCVLFQPSVPGCAYSDYSSPGRIGQSFCMAHCNGDSDCRQGDGYVCDNPRAGPWYAAILDDNQNQRVCIYPSHQVSMAPPSDAGPSVCAAPLPLIPEAGGESPVDATVGALDDGSGDAPGDGSGDALSDGSAESGEGAVPMDDGMVDALGGSGAGDGALVDGPAPSGDAAEGAVVDGSDDGSPDASLGDGAAEGSVDADTDDAPDGG